MGYIPYNNNPMNKSVGDCVIRAVSIATGQTWDEAFWGLADKAFDMGDMPSSNAVWSEYLRDYGFKRYAIPDTCPDCYSIGEFADEHANCVYVVGTGTHAVAIVDGDVIDAWDSRNEIPIYYFRKEH